MLTVPRTDAIPIPSVVTHSQCLFSHTQLYAAVRTDTCVRLTFQDSLLDPTTTTHTHTKRVSLYPAECCFVFIEYGACFVNSATQMSRMTQTEPTRRVAEAALRNYTCLLVQDRLRLPEHLIERLSDPRFDQIHNRHGVS
jgi:hypothetical protein